MMSTIGQTKYRREGAFFVRPTKRAIRMANAIMMERILTSGRFSSVREFSEALGVSQPVVSNALKMLNLPPDEIERILFEVR